MGALLDHRPGVVTKGFRTLAHEQEQDDRWHLDQPEEDEALCDSFTSSAPISLLHSTSVSSLCCNKKSHTDANSQAEGLNGGICSAREAVERQDGHLGNMSLSSLSSLSPAPSPSDISRHMDFKELQALQPTTVDHLPGEGAS